MKDNPNAAVAKPVKVADTRVTAEQRIKTKSYTVKRGEYLKMIAERYALSNQELADLTRPDFNQQPAGRSEESKFL